jgi:hypothetical protein
MIRNIVFDIGWVLVRLNYRPLLDFLKAHGADFHERDAVMGRIEPPATVFIDDRPDNIATACARGWQGIVHAHYHGTLAALRSLEVRC